LPSAFSIAEHTATSARHTTGYLASGAVDAPLLIFIHGWPELSLSWRHQLPAFAALGFRCIAPDMRGYGRSSTYHRHEVGSAAAHAPTYRATRMSSPRLIWTPTPRR